MKEPVSLPFGGDPTPAEVWYIKGGGSFPAAADVSLTASVLFQRTTRDIDDARQKPASWTQ